MALSELVVGTICGGSDANSGLTANPAIGVAFDLLVAQGAATISMASSSRRYMLLTAIAALTAAPVVDAQMSKCTDAAGKVTYQQKPCEASSAEKTINIDGARTKPPTAPASATPEMRDSASERARKHEQGIGMVLFVKFNCDAQFPGFSSRIASNFEAFRRRYQETIRKIEASPEFLSMQEDARRKAATKQDPSRVADFKTQCDNVEAAFVEFNAPADPRMQTPELAWQGMLAAMRAGDHTAATRFLTGRATKSLGEALPRMPADAMRTMADSFVGFSISYQDVDVAEVFVSRTSAKGNRVGSIEFVKVGPNWKISGL